MGTPMRETIRVDVQGYGEITIPKWWVRRSEAIARRLEMTPEEAFVTCASNGLRHPERAYRELADN
jgi:hypothetical protein